MDLTHGGSQTKLADHGEAVELEAQTTPFIIRHIRHVFTIETSSSESYIF